MNGRAISVRGDMIGHAAWCLDQNFPVPSDGRTRDAVSAQPLCGQRCPTPGCGRPCRGYAGHDLPHECNQHHTW